jgi:hypothetical protein
MRGTDHIWGRPKPAPDRCRGPHTYGGGCTFNADDPHRPLFPEQLRPGARNATAA